MNFFESLRSPRTVLLSSLVISAIILYPNINEFIWSALAAPGTTHHKAIGAANILYFSYRYLFFSLLTWILIRLNIKTALSDLKRRFWHSFVITLGAYTIYVIIGSTLEYAIRRDCFTQMLILQFIIAWLVPVLIGQIYNLTVIQREKEREIERLRSENLQSRVDALSNQINPHFFFNSLNGLAALVAAKRESETTQYIAKLSGIFRYILQSDKKELVTLGEELKFLDAYRYLIEIRYSGKICFEVDIPLSDMQMQLPVLSLLPIVENVIKHNIIDSEHPMTVRIYTESTELIVSNRVHHKLDVECSNGIGLTNLAARYRLLAGAQIKIKSDSDNFTVRLPLKKSVE